MEYANNAYAGEGPACADRPYLARLVDLADETDRIAGYLQSFIDRCRGGATSEGSKGQIAPVPSGHLGQLDRLVQSIARVDALSRELQTIG